MPSNRSKRKSDISTVNAEVCLPGYMLSREETVEKAVTPRKRTKRESITAENATENGVVEESRGKKSWLMKAEPDSRIVKGKVDVQLILLKRCRISNSVLMISRT